MLSLIVAMSESTNAIGIDNRLPWRLKGELAYFKQTTIYHPVIMGRKTFDSLNRKLLADRYNIVVSRYEHTDLGDMGIFCHSLEAAIFQAGQWKVKQEQTNQYHHSDEIFVIGGAQLYAQIFDKADRLYITYVEKHIEGDAFFPKIDASQWRIREIKNGSHDVIDYPSDQPHYHIKIMDKIH